MLLLKYGKLCVCAPAKGEKAYNDRKCDTYLSILIHAKKDIKIFCAGSTVYGVDWVKKKEFKIQGVEMKEKYKRFCLKVNGT